MKETVLIRARYVVPLVSEPIEDGALLIEAGRIAGVGRFSALRREGVAIVDYGEALLLPPLVNAHCHLELTNFQQWAAACGETAEPTSFVGWIQRLVRVRRRTGLEAVPEAVAAGIAELLAGGTGAVGDILTTPTGLAPLLASPLSGRVFFETLGLEEVRYAPLLAAALEAAPGLVAPLRGGLSPHATYTVSAEHLHAAVTAARSAGLPLAIHCAESPAESALLHDGNGPIADELYPLAGWERPVPTGLSPVAWLDRHGALGPQTLLIHGVQVDAADAALIAARGATVVLCPRSNARLQVGTAPVALYRQQGVRLALGTDSLASNDSLSLWDEIAFARSRYPEFSPTELLVIATGGGAQALGLDGELGTFATGCGANLQVVSASTLPPQAELAEWLCSAEHRVAALWLGGRERLAGQPDQENPPPCQIAAQRL